jgi:Leucine Rich repeat
MRFYWTTFVVALLIVIAVLIPVQRYRYEQAIIDELKAHRWFIAGEPIWPDWIGRYLWVSPPTRARTVGAGRPSEEDCQKVAKLRDIVTVDFTFAELTDASLSYLVSLPQLSFLYLEKCSGITDDGMKHVGQLKHLRRLELSWLPISDRGIGSLGGLNELRYLNLNNTGVTDLQFGIVPPDGELETLSINQTPLSDEEFRVISTIRSLRELYAFETNATDAGIAYLAGAASLRTLCVSGDQITDHGLEALTKLPLEALGLYKTRVTDDGARLLATMHTLTHVFLEDTEIGDEAVAQIAMLPRLKQLGLAGTRVTPKGLAPLARVKTLEALTLTTKSPEAESLEKLNPNLAIILVPHESGPP